MNREEILKTASQYVTKDRAATHGDAEDNFDNIADLWSWWLHGREIYAINGFDVAVMMTLFKIARIKANPSHVDSYVDGAGYLAIAGEIACMER
jgi:hypothetical protein